jgi:hypothetical protein
VRSQALTLDHLYARPDELNSLEECQRFHHLDLAHLSLPALLLEEDRLEDRLRHDLKPDRWFLERYDVIQAEKARRG